MADRRTDIITALESGMERTCAFFGALSAEELETKVYQDGAQWTVRQVLAHFVTIETSMQWLFRNILDGGPGSPRNFDVERFNREQPARFEGHSLDDLLAAFRTVRKKPSPSCGTCRTRIWTDRAGMRFMERGPCRASSAGPTNMPRSMRMISAQ
jgi:hypothetical protein